MKTYNYFIEENDDEGFGIIRAIYENQFGASVFEKETFKDKKEILKIIAEDLGVEL